MADVVRVDEDGAVDRRHLTHELRREGRRLHRDALRAEASGLRFGAGGDDDHRTVALIRRFGDEPPERRDLRRVDLGEGLRHLPSELDRVDALLRDPRLTVAHLHEDAAVELEAPGVVTGEADDEVPAGRPLVASRAEAVDVAGGAEQHQTVPRDLEQLPHRAVVAQADGAGER
ncbi:hypothetical protein BH23DEI1_BH23DEI1_21160 [soil metagenome]